MRNILFFILMAFLLIISFNNCKESSELKDHSVNNQKMGMFKFLVAADSSSPTWPVAGTKEEVTSLVVTIETLEVHRTGDGDAGWKSLPIAEGTFDLIALDNASLEEIIASTEIESGNYNKIRFAVISATVTTESGIYEAEIPSKVIKISVPFVVYEDGHTEITVEINPKASLNISGSKNNPKYILRPVLKVTDVEEEGEEGDD